VKERGVERRLSS